MLKDTWACHGRALETHGSVYTFGLNFSILIIENIGQLSYLHLILHLPLDLPFFPLKALVYGLANRVLHEVNVSDDLWGEGVSDMLMELSILEIICNLSLLVKGHY